jgi:hypothetical protein
MISICLLLFAGWIGGACHNLYLENCGAPTLQHVSEAILQNMQIRGYPVIASRQVVERLTVAKGGAVDPALN